MLDKTTHKLDAIIKQAYDLLYSPSRTCLTSLPLQPTSTCDLPSIRFISLKTKSPIDSLDGWTPLLNALNGLDSTIAYIIHMEPCGNTTFFLAIKSNCIETALSLLVTGLNASYPQFEIKILSSTETAILPDENLLNPYCYCSLSISSFTPNILTASESTALIQQFLSLMAGSDLTLVLLSSSASNSCVTYLIQLLENLSTELSSFASVNHTSNTRKFENDSCTDTQTENDSSTCTSSKNTTHTDTNTNANGETSTYSGNGRLIDAVSTTLTGTCTKNITTSFSESTNNTTTDSNSSSCTNSCSTVKGSGSEEGHSHSYRKDNKTVATLLTQINAYLTRLYALRFTSNYEFAAYFLSNMAATNIRGAYLYTQLFSNKSLNLQPSTINTWDNSHPDFNKLFLYLCQLNHPCFIHNNCELVTPATLISSSELEGLLFVPTSNKKENSNE